LFFVEFLYQVKKGNRNQEQQGKSKYFFSEIVLQKIQEAVLKYYFILSGIRCG